MKAKELMIGDWVSMRLPNNAYVEIGKIYSVDAVKDKLLIVEPIPLTEEILKANGFILRREPNEYYLNCDFLDNDGQRSCVEIFIYNKYCMVIECNYKLYINRVHLVISHVHELQHALRLCGLNILADNFKVE